MSRVKRKNGLLLVVGFAVLLCAAYLVGGCVHTDQPPLAVAPVPPPAVPPAAVIQAQQAPQREEASPSIPVEHVTAEAPRIEGIVYDLLGTAVEGAVVRAALGEGASAHVTQESVEVSSGADGRFSLALPGYGLYGLSASGEAGMTFQRERVSVTQPLLQVTLVLRPAKRLCGVVLSGSRPVAGAVLKAAKLDGQPLKKAENATLTAATNGAGEFCFAGLPMGDWQFQVTAEGYASLLSDPIATGTERATIQLRPGAVVSGLVLDAETQQPVGDILVTAAPENAEAGIQEAVSQEDGRFSFASLAPGTVTFGIRDARYVLPEGTSPVSIPPAGIQNLKLHVREGGRILGTVVDADTSAALANIAVAARAHGVAGAPVRESISLEDGSFEIIGLSQNNYEVAVSRGKSGMVGVEAVPVSVQLEAGQVLAGVTLAVHLGACVSGRVVRKDGSPAPGAQINLQLGGMVGFQSNCNAAGEFFFAGVPEQEVTVQAHDQAYASALSGPHKLTGAGLRDLVLTLDEPADGMLSGGVVDERGRPLRVALVARHENHSAIRSFETGADGQFLLSGLPAGAWQLSARVGDVNPRDLLQVQLSPSQTIRNLRLVYSTGELQTISGRVVSWEGKPVKAQVGVSEEIDVGDGNVATGFIGGAATDTGGSYEVRGLNAGNYQLSVKADGFASAQRAGVAAGSTGVDFELQPELMLQGHVTDEQGKPLTFFEIGLAYPREKPLEEINFHQISDSAGFFSIPMEDSFHYAWVRSPGYQTTQFTVGRMGVDFEGEQSFALPRQP